MTAAVKQSAGGRARSGSGTGQRVRVKKPFQKKAPKIEYKLSDAAKAERKRLLERRRKLIEMMAQKVESAPAVEIKEALKHMRRSARASLGEIFGAIKHPAEVEVARPAPLKSHRNTNVEATLAQARARGEAMRQKLIEDAGGLLTTAQAAAAAGLTTAGLHKRKKERQALAVPVEGGDTGWPRFQFESPDMIVGVQKVLKKIGVDSPWMQVSFFLTRIDELGNKRPIDLIRAGRIEPVELAASHIGEHGAA